MTVIVKNKMDIIIRYDEYNLILNKMYRYHTRVGYNITMSFYGKKYRRTACENVDELLAATKNREIAYLVKCRPPTICFTKPDEETLILNLEVEDRNYLASFKFGEEKEIERRDGCKIKITFTEESENVLKQVVRMPDGKSAFFTREFGDKESTMTISLPESNVKATIHFERIE